MITMNAVKSVTIRVGCDNMPDANITKSALASSMKILMKEKPLTKISVIDI